VLEAAALAGYKTGLVVTTRITDATPACFASHVNLRQYEDRIAEQEIGEHPLGRVVDLMFGGGRCHFLPNTTEGSCRGDDRDLVEIAGQKGFNYLDDRKSFDSLNGGTEAKLPLIGLFAGGDIPYEIDRRSQDDVYPSLEEMARTALKTLSQATADSEQGFFIMIEGSRIDHAGHGNDPAAQVHEVLAYDRAFAAVLEFLENDSTPGIVVSTSDHETGGLAAARQLHDTYPEYKWLPGVLANASHSSEYAGQVLRDFVAKESDKAAQRKFTRELLEKALGIMDATKDEIDHVIDPNLPYSQNYVFADIISRRAQIGWSTHGHSCNSSLPSPLSLIIQANHIYYLAVDVNIYASSTKDAWRLVGNNENTDIGSFLAEYLEVDVEAVTKRLQSSKEWDWNPEVESASAGRSWLGDPLGEDVRTEGLDTYHGEFKKRSVDVNKRECGCGELH
jgi:alkaline phosphatase